MPCQILVSNQSSVNKAELVVMFGEGHKWGKRETMQSWIASGESYESWDRTFSLVIVKDKSVNEIGYIFDKLENGENKCHFKDPDHTDPVFEELYRTGQIKADWETVSSYLIERV